MEPQIATNSDQSARLIACGVPEESADMVWVTGENGGEKQTQLFPMDVYDYEVKDLNPVPAWSLPSLLGMLPVLLKNDYYLIIGPYKGQWVISYVDSWANERFCRFAGDDLIECCVQAVEWMMENRP